MGSNKSKTSRRGVSGCHSQASTGVIALMTFLLGASLLPLIAVTSEPVQAQPSFSIEWDLVRDGIIHKEFEITIDNPLAPISLSVAPRFLQTNFDSNQITDVELYKQIEEDYQENVADWGWVEENVQDNENIWHLENIWGVVGTHLENRTRDVWQPVSFSNLTISLGLNVFKLGFDVPLVKSENGWGSRGLVNFDIGGALYGSEYIGQPGSSWWNDSWQYRKLNPINGTTAGAQTDYQMKMTVHKGTGTDSTTDVYLGANVRDDFGDVRWVTTSEVEIDYWIESYTSGDKADFCAEIPSIPASPSTVDTYVYYGNSGATTTSSGNDTFIFFDDAESGIPSDKWTNVLGTTLVYDAATSYQGTKSLKATGGDGVFAATGVDAADAVFEAYVKSSGTYGNACMLTGRASTSAKTFYGGRPNYNNKSELYKRVDGSWALLDSGSPQDYFTWHKWSLICSDSSIKFLWDDSELVSATNSDIASGSVGGRVGGTNTSLWFDLIRVRKYASPEPTWGTWGGEEATSTTEYERSIEQEFSLAGLAPSGVEFGRAITQDFGFGAVVAVIMEFVRVISQSFGVAAVVGIGSEWKKSINQDFSLTGDVSANMERWGAIDQAFSVDGVVSRELEAGRTIVQSFSLNAEVEGVSEFAVALVQSFSLIGAVGTNKEISRGIGQDFEFSAAATAQASFIRELSEELSFTATSESQCGYTCGIAQGFSFSAALDDSEEYGISLSEDFSLGATVDVAVEKEIRIDQDFDLTGAVQAARELGISVTQTYSVSDEVMAKDEYGKSLAQEFSFAGEVTIDVVRRLKVYNYDVSDGFSFAGVVITALWYNKPLSLDFSFTGTVEVDVVVRRPEPIGPIENQPYFAWSYEADNWRLLVDNDFDFSSPCENRILFENHYQIPPENALENGIYHWKISAYFGGGEVESNVYNFVVGGTGEVPSAILGLRPVTIGVVVAIITGATMAVLMSKREEEEGP